jgi:hypothetical protein
MELKTFKKSHHQHDYKFNIRLNFVSFQTTYPEVSFSSNRHGLLTALMQAEEPVQHSLPWQQLGNFAFSRSSSFFTYRIISLQQQLL